MGEIPTKLLDALQMFWQALDEHERRVLLYMAVYFAVSLALSAQARSRERLKSELREEMIARGAA